MSNRLSDPGPAKRTSRESKPVSVKNNIPNTSSNTHSTSVSSITNSHPLPLQTSASSAGNVGKDEANPQSEFQSLKLGEDLSDKDDDEGQASIATFGLEIYTIQY
jgi:hypothetical protein